MYGYSAIQGLRYDILVLLCGTRIVPIACGWTRREARKAGMVCFFLVPNTNRLKVAKLRRDRIDDSDSPNFRFSICHCIVTPLYLVQMWIFLP